MTTKKQAKAAEEAGTLVYCGPTIPGVAKQFTFYRGGVTAGLKAAPATPCRATVVLHRGSITRSSACSAYTARA